MEAKTDLWLWPRNVLQTCVDYQWRNEISLKQVVQELVDTWKKTLNVDSVS